MIHDDFNKALHPAWHITEQGIGQVNHKNNALHLSHPVHDKSAYSNAQLSDYDTNRQFNLRPPLRLTLTAQANTADLRGTAGFGFWNHPFAPGSSHLDLPQALWFFFASQESNMALAQDVPGNGWKAATFNAKRLPFLGLLPTAPLAMPLMNIPAIYDSLWHIGQRAIGVSETALDSALLAEKHTYTLDWLPHEAIFKVDNDIVLHAKHGITQNPLGFVAWLDNQYAIVSPKGRFGFGFVDVPHAQTLTLHNIHIEAHQAGGV